jgi:hypothetical protein
LTAGRSYFFWAIVLLVSRLTITIVVIKIFPSTSLRSRRKHKAQGEAKRNPGFK